MSLPDLSDSFLSALWPFAIFLPLILALRLALDRVEKAAESRRLERRHGTLEQRLETAAAQMTSSRELLDGVERELEARQASLVRLRAETQEWRDLARIKKSEADAVSRLLRREVDRSGRRSFWQGLALNVGFFLLGLTVPLLTGR